MSKQAEEKSLAPEFNSILKGLPHHLGVRIMTETVTPISDFMVTIRASKYLFCSTALLSPATKSCCTTCWQQHTSAEDNSSMMTNSCIPYKFC
uniref:Uncharacterized protein n=1 Tax=Arion vulgaris TaxID=1028688 RepID=A0A0B7AZR5_9EUPU